MKKRCSEYTQRVILISPAKIALLSTALFVGLGAGGLCLVSAESKGDAEQSITNLAVARDIFGGDLQNDPKIQLMTYTSDAENVGKTDISVPSDLVDRSPADYQVVKELMGLVNSYDYEYDYAQKVLSINCSSDMRALLDNLYLIRNGDVNNISTIILASGEYSMDPAFDTAMRYDMRSDFDGINIRLASLIKYIEAIGGCVDTDKLSPKLFTNRVRMDWDIPEEEVMRETSKQLEDIRSLSSPFGGHSDLAELGETQVSEYIQNLDVSYAPADPYAWGGDLRMTTDITVEQIASAACGVLPRHAEFLKECEQKYSINVGFIIAVARSESSGGTAGYGASRGNVFSIRKSNGSYKNYMAETGDFDSAVRRSIEDFCILISSEYLSSNGACYGGGYSSYAVGKIYAEAPNWADTIESARQDFFSAVGAV